MGPERSPSVFVTLWVIVVLKVIAAVAALVFVGVGSGQLPAWTRGRRTRLLGWIAAVGLTVYGGVLTVVGLLVQAGLIQAADDADRHALAWHAFVWDPWFALWGIAFAVAMWRSRPQAADIETTDRANDGAPSLGAGAGVEGRFPSSRVGYGTQRTTRWSDVGHHGGRSFRFSGSKSCSASMPPAIRTEPSSSVTATPVYG